MSLNIYKADATYQRYFSKEALESGACYVVSDANSIVGMFTFIINQNQAELSFPYCFNKNAILLSVETFLDDYPDIMSITLKSKQNLESIGFKNKLYTRGAK